VHRNPEDSRIPADNERLHQHQTHARSTTNSSPPPRSAASQRIRETRRRRSRVCGDLPLVHSRRLGVTSETAPFRA